MPFWFSVKNSFYEWNGITCNALSLDPRTGDSLSDPRLSNTISQMDDIINPRSFFMLQQLQRDWGTRDTWTWDRSFWARKNYRWVLLDSFLIRFLIPPCHLLPSSNPSYHLHSFPSVSDVKSGIPFTGMIYRDPRINYPSTACIMDLSLLFHR